MIISTPGLGRLAVLGVLAAATVAAPAASAESGPLPYTCTIGSGSSTAEGSVSVVLDTAVPDGFVSAAGAEVVLDPVTAQVTISADYAQGLRDTGLETLVPNGVVFPTLTSPTGTTTNLQDIVFEDQTPVPLGASGPVSFTLTGGTYTGAGVEPLAPTALGDYSIGAGDLNLGFGACAFSGSVDGTIDEFTVVEAEDSPSPSPTATPSESETPTAAPTTVAPTTPGPTTPGPTAVRPALVQTDAADSAPAPWTAAGLAALVLAAAAVVTAMTRRSTARRH